MHRLVDLGWTPFFADQLGPADQGLTVARVAEEHRDRYRILGEGGSWLAEPSGRLRRDPAAPHPSVGDWVLARTPEPGAEGVASIRRVLERRTRFARKEAGLRSAEQVVAANVDTVFLVMSLNANLNPRRLERYLALLWESGALPVVVLSKADLVADPAPLAAEIEQAAPGVAVHVTSAVSPEGLAPLAPYLEPGRTVALVGSSGVGKSSIVNHLLGEERMAVREIRDDDRGRHTTTARQLVLLPGGGLLLDTPGMRTVLMWEGEDGLARAFPDVEALAAACRFRDCRHESEPGCAVRAAVASGELPAERLQSHRKLEREIRYVASRSDVRLRLEEQRRWRLIHRQMRKRPDRRGG